MKITGTASILRHGATRYTGEFPDLVDEGLPMVNAIAKEITNRFPKRPIFFSSPADRAIATALHVMREYGLGWKREWIQIEPSLGPIWISDSRPLHVHTERVIGHLTDTLERHKAWDSFYMENAEFDNGLFCESRSSAKNRLADFLKQLPALCGPNHHVIVVTHIELIGSIVCDWFDVGKDHFGPAEAVHLSFTDSQLLQVEFRGEIKTISTDLS